VLDGWLIVGCVNEVEQGCQEIFGWELLTITKLTLKATLGWTVSLTTFTKIPKFTLIIYPEKINNGPKCNTESSVIFQLQNSNSILKIPQGHFLLR
jgi:hypothetical protein